MDPRCQHCFALVADENFSTISSSSSSSSFSVSNTSMSFRNQVPGRPCLGCQACYFCFDCIQRGFHHTHTTTPTTGGGACTTGRGTTECQEYVLERRQGSILKRSIPSFSVAVKKTAFGEGAERVAFKFRYIDAAGRFVGPKMVAKESRFVQDQYHPDDDDDNDDRDQAGHAMSSTGQRRAYHTQFLQTQAIAARFADLFNKALDDLVKLAPKRFRRQLKEYPRIRFVEPLVFELQEGNTHYHNNTGTVTMSATPAHATPPIINYLLVEPMIEGTYMKFNNNMGAVVDVRSENDQQKDPENNSENHQSDIIISQAQEMMLISRNDLHSSTSSGNSSNCNSQLKVIQEESESSCIDEDDDDANSHNEASGTGESRAKPSRNVNKDDCNNKDDKWCIDKDLLKTQVNGNSSISRPSGSFSNVHDSDFPQAFSHFTYVKSKRNIMVVDLQGTLTVDVSSKRNGKREFVLTDPAIHKRRRNGAGTGLLRTLNFGRTNRGHKGMQAFFETHCCNDVCRMLGLPEEEKPKAKPAAPPSSPICLPIVSSSDSGNVSV